MDFQLKMLNIEGLARKRRYRNPANAQFLELQL